MKLPCIVRTGRYGSMFRSYYNTETGTVDNVPEYLLRYTPPPTVMKILNTIQYDVPFTEITLNACLEKMVSMPYLNLVFADFGNHLYVAAERVTSVISINMDDAITVSNIDVPVLFSTKSYAVGRFRQSLVTFNVPTEEYQLIIAYEMPDGFYLYHNGKQFVELPKDVDLNPDFSKMSIIQLAKCEDENTIGMISSNGIIKYLTRD